MASLARSLLASGSYNESERYKRSSSAAKESQKLALSTTLSNQKGKR